MTTTFDNRLAGHRPAVDDALPPPCRSCGHDESSHDATATRFCRATLDRARDRACICRRPNPAEGPGAPMYGRGGFSGR